MLKNFVKSIIVQWEKLICRIKRIQPLEGSNYGLLCIRKTKYKGETLRLTDNSFLNKGDCIIELHLSNIVMAKGIVAENATVSLDLRIISYMRGELFILGRYLRLQGIDSRIKSIGGVTIHGPGIRRLGFSLYPGKNTLSNSLVFIWMRILRWTFSNPKEAVRLRKRSLRHLEHFYMPISQFIQKYGA